MKKSFMSNIKNFVDSNVRQRIDRVAHNYSDPLTDDLLLVERHFEDLRQVCIDADKKISALLQSIQLSSNPSHLGAYTQNVQAGLNNLSQNISIQTTNIASSVGATTSINCQTKASDTLKSSHQPDLDPKSSLSSNNTQQYRLGEPFNNGSNTLTSSHDSLAPASREGTDCHLREQLSDDIQQRYKKLPVVGFYKFLVKSNQKLKQDSLLAQTLSQCSQLQIQLTNLYLSHECLIETQCLKPIQHMLEVDIPNVMKLRKLYIKSHNDYEFLKGRYNGASLKQQQQQQNQQAAQPGHFSNTSYLISQNSIQQTNATKLDQLKNELDEAVTRFEQAKDTYEAELYGFVCRETELVNLLRMFYQYQTEYHLKVGNIMQGLMPSLSESLALTPRKSAFGTELTEHLRCTGRAISPVIELCTHFLHLQALDEEGLFRIPGSSVKIKKLKNGINAWFLSLASLEELESDLKQQSGYHCISTLYDLFKSSIGQRNYQAQVPQQASLVANSAIKSTLAVDETALSQTNYINEVQDDDEMILDVHSIAGLLKLYLRDLPEPLCTYALYDDWIRCVDSKADVSKRLDMIAAVIKKLPPTYKANLKHLVKFLHLLTHHREQNKMTSTNLAIAMAPSLLWSKPVENIQDDDATDDAQTLNMQMSTFGISASNHAMILEALINNADTLFSEPDDFTLPGFEHLKFQPNKTRQSVRSRSVKSTSPTGLSTASSSSFSSNASNSLSPPNAVKGHNRKGGSMEGLLGCQEVSALLQHQNSSSRSAGRPVSVQIQRDEYSASVKLNQAKPPPKPPIPLIRSHSKQASCDEQSHHVPLKTTHNKPPAPPVPPPTTVRHHLERIKAAKGSPTTPDLAPDNQKPRPTSLRGTGTIDQSGSGSSASANACHPTPRPTVPPPERPQTSADLDNDARGGSDEVTIARSVEPDNGPLDGTKKTSIDTGSPPVISLDSVSEGGSSFDNDDESQHSLEQSWSKRSISNESSSVDVMAATRTTTPTTTKATVGRSHPVKRRNDSNGSASDISHSNDNRGRSSAPMGSTNDLDRGKQPPVRPPRSTSPKITQSTPL